MDDIEFMATLTSLTNPNKPKNMVQGIKMDDGIPSDVLKIKTDLMLQDWKFTIAVQNRGYCSQSKRLIVLPVWLWNPRSMSLQLETHGEQATTQTMNAYRTWYLCHEMSHALVEVYHNHDAVFMRKLIEICPEESLHYELGYKPRNAKSAGIGKRKSQSIEQELGFE